jgi:hypothetical protein
MFVIVTHIRGYHQVARHQLRIPSLSLRINAPEQLTILQHALMIPDQLISHLDLIIPFPLQSVPDAIPIEPGHLFTQLVHDPRLDHPEVGDIDQALILSIRVRLVHLVVRSRGGPIDRIGNSAPSLTQQARGIFPLPTTLSGPFQPGRLRERLQVLRQIPLKPSRLSYPRRRDPLDRIDDEHALQQRPGVFGKVGGEVIDPAVDLLKELGDVLVVKGQAAAEHDVKDDAARPDVDLWTCV